MAHGSPPTFWQLPDQKQIDDFAQKHRMSEEFGFCETQWDLNPHRCISWDMYSCRCISSDPNPCRCISWEIRPLHRWLARLRCCRTWLACTATVPGLPALLPYLAYLRCCRTCLTCAAAAPASPALVSHLAHPRRVLGNTSACSPLSRGPVLSLPKPIPFPICHSQWLLQRAWAPFASLRVNLRMVQP
jgi:hypothetical protein